MSTNELNTTAKELLSIRSMIAELEAEAEALTDKLKAAMVERGTEALQAGRCGFESGLAGGGGPLHSHQHRPPLLRGMRKAPISQPTKARGYRSL